MSTTIVPPFLASTSQGMVELGLVGSSLPLTIVKVVDMPLWVSGMPAYAGPAMAEVTPGIISKGSPLALSSNASSPPRPNTKGSPPFNRTTV